VASFDPGSGNWLARAVLWWDFSEIVDTPRL